MMATDRVARILKSSGKFSDDEIARMTEDEAWAWIRAHIPLPRPVDIESRKTENNQRQ
jgi:hypothetical protein